MATQDTPGEPRNTVRASFPGYFGRTDDDLQHFIAHGLVVLDSNVLLGLYRFTDESRKECLEAFTRVGERLWVPYQVMDEFLRNRREEIRRCAQATVQLARALKDPFASAQALVADFAHRRRLSRDAANALTAILDKAEKDIAAKAKVVYPFAINPDVSPDDDPVFQAVEALVDGKIGPDFTAEERGRANKDGEKRINNRIPPGYEDRFKDGDRSLGDFFLWRQTIIKAKECELPVLLVTNDSKEDWVQKPTSGPRSELVLEMNKATGQDFHLVNVHDFLLLAQSHLQAEVSDATVEQAAADDDDWQDAAILDNGAAAPGTAHRPSDRPPASFVEALAAKQRQFEQFQSVMDAQTAPAQRMMEQIQRDAAPLQRAFQDAARATQVLRQPIYTSAISDALRATQHLGDYTDQLRRSMLPPVDQTGVWGAVRSGMYAEDDVSDDGTDDDDAQF